MINYIGTERHNIIKNKRIICMGTIWGTLDKILEFSIIIWKKLKSTGFPRSDQCVANCLFYLDNILEDYLVKNDNYGPIMTLALTKSKNIILDSKKNILNFRGEIAAVIHQYDRKNNLRMIIINKFCPEILKTISSVKGYSNIFEKKYTKINI